MNSFKRDIKTISLIATVDCVKYFLKILDCYDCKYSFADRFIVVN